MIQNIAPFTRCFNSCYLLYKFARSIENSAYDAINLTRGTCNYEMINKSNTLQRVHQVTFEVCIAHFVVACSPELSDTHTSGTCNYEMRDVDF